MKHSQVEIDLPLVDMTQTYPKKEYEIQEMASVKYIPLETTDSVLLGDEHVLHYYSDQLIVFSNHRNGDILMFDGQGSFLRLFNRKGGSGADYQNVASLVVDPLAHELFVRDVQKTQVYSLEGTYLRTLPCPEGYRIEEIVNFDTQHLLAYDCSHITAHSSDSCRTQPYFLFSKQDGQVTANLDLVMKKRISNRIISELDGATMPVMLAYKPLVKMGEDIWIGDISCDTIFQIQADRSLKPLLIRTPSVHAVEGTNRADKHIWTIGLNSPDYLFFSNITYAFDPQKMNFPRLELLYDRKETKFYAYQLKNRDYSTENPIDLNWPTFEAPVSTYCQLLNQDQLQEALEHGKLSGPLKTLVSTLEIDANPVLMVIDFH